jgi:hypothetical protein
VYSIFPHSHKVCTSTINYAQNGSTIIPLCRVNKWNFEWQGFYTFPKMVKIPNGYTLKGTHLFDNTSANPDAPVSVPVYAGVSTADEMLFDGLMWTNYLPGDELIDIGALLAADPLLNNPVGIKQNEAVSNSMSVFPNPFHETLSIQYELNSTEFVSVSFYNVNGQEVATLPSKLNIPGKHSISWDGKSNSGATLPSGLYTYKLAIGKNHHTGKIMWQPKDE